MLNGVKSRAISYSLSINTTQYFSPIYQEEFFSLYHSFFSKYTINSTFYNCAKSEKQGRCLYRLTHERLHHRHHWNVSISPVIDSRTRCLIKIVTRADSASESSCCLSSRYIILLFSGIDLSKKSDCHSSATPTSANDKDIKAKDDGRKSAIPVGIAVARQRSGASSKHKGLLIQIS